MEILAKNSADGTFDFTKLMIFSEGVLVLCLTIVKS
jgi:hypothetical protein